MPLKAVALIVTSLIVALSACLSGIAFASPNPTQPEAQFNLAQQLSDTTKSDSPADARYWLERSARQGYLPAQKQLAKDYAHGLNGNVDSTQAIYWFTSVALNDPNDRGFLLADFVHNHGENISNSDLVEAWYQLAAEHNSQAEQAYYQFLEARFNQLRANQVANIDELEMSTAEEAEQGIGAAQDVQQVKPSHLWFVLGALGLVLLLSGGVFGYRKQIHKAKGDREEIVTHSQHLALQLKESQFANKQLKRQLEKVFKEFKKAKAYSDKQKLALACAMFGYTPQTVPSPSAVKLRYRQLSKLYHPDTKGSEDEMKRLNQALNIILQNVTQK